MAAPAMLELRLHSAAPLASPGLRDPAARLRGLLYPGPYATAAAASLVLAAISLLLPSAPSYDPWAWIIWGREVVHLGLVTTGGPTWKPLPVIVTTLFAPLGGAAPGLWLLVARTGGIMGLAMCCMLASRLARAGSGARAAASVAGALAVIGLVALPGYADSVASGESEGLLVALIALAVLRHCDGARRQALLLGFVASLIRPETWPFLGVYGIYLWRRDPRARVLIAALFALIPALWFAPELWGARSVLRGIDWARYPRAGSPAFAHCPFCAELSGHAWPLLLTPFKLGVALAIAGIAVSVRTRSTVRVLAVLGLTWILEEAVLTQLGFSGSDRYLIAPVAVLIVVGAAGCSWALGAVRSPVAAAALAILLVASIPLSGSDVIHPTAIAARQRFDARLRADMHGAVQRAGGPRRLIACGAIQTNPSEAPLAAWTLGVEMLWAENPHGNVLIQSGNAQRMPRLPTVSPGAGYQLAAEVGGVRIFERCRR